MPNLYIIAGCNGAGKTTASFSILPDLLHCNEFVNADEIARGLSPFRPDSVAFQAGRIMLGRIKFLISEQVDFAFETTLSTRSYLKLIAGAKEEGYRVTLVFFWLNSPELAIERVRNRVSEGGHSIPPHTIVRRYHRGMLNFGRHFMALADEWVCVDNSGQSPVPVAVGVTSNTMIYNKTIWKIITHG